MRSMLTGIAGLCLISALIGPAHRFQDPGEPRTVQDGVFNAEQVERGREVFETSCLECHLLDDFKGPFLSSWEGATVNGLYEQVRATMPFETPGTLKQQEYIDVLAYIFQVNGLPTGEAELEADRESLERIVIEGPFGQEEERP